MQTHAGALAQQGVPIGLEIALVIKAVSAFMQARHDTGGEIVFADTNGEAHIIGSRLERKRMGGSIKPAALEFEAEGGQHAPAEVPLMAIREMAAFEFSVG